MNQKHDCNNYMKHLLNNTMTVTSDRVYISVNDWLRQIYLPFYLMHVAREDFELNTMKNDCQTFFSLSPEVSDKKTNA